MLTENIKDTLSVTGRIWQELEADEQSVAAISREYSLPQAVARILVARGVNSEDVENFLNPTLRNLLPDPSHLLDMDMAVARIADAIKNNEKIAIWGDYDVDGATSSALLFRYFRALKIIPVVYIPDRMKEGYGPNSPALLKLKEQGVKLVITVDCGTLSFEPLKAAKEAGLDVVVVDHHIGEAKKPEAVAIVNPNRLDENSPHGQMAAVGVTFLLLAALNRELRLRNYFIAVVEPDIKQWLDIVALGTVCDVVPLTGVNRALVAQGLKIMSLRRNTGIATILDLTKIEEKPNTYTCGFIIGPRINAGGRVGRSDLGVRLLTTEDVSEAKNIAAELEQYNAERKAIEALVLEDAIEQAKNMDPSLPVMVVSGKGWHIGVIGIVAGRLKELFAKPVAVIAINDNMGKASARSVTGVDFGAAVIAALESGLLVAGGGHAMAAGFTVEEEKISVLTEFLTRSMAAQIKSISGQKKLPVDSFITINGINSQLLTELEKLAPFGQGNPNIRLAVKNVVNLKPEIVGENHIKTIFTDKIDRSRLSAIAFRVAGTPLGKALLETRGKAVSIAGQPRLQEWNGRQNISFIIDDIIVENNL